MRTSKSGLVLLLAVGCLVAALPAQAATVRLREGGGAFHVDTTFDDVYIDVDTDSNYADTAAYYAIRARNDGGGNLDWVSLFGVKDLFTLIPLYYNGYAVQIDSATMRLYGYNTGAGHTVDLYRVTTNWMPDGAGANEADVSGLHSEISSGAPWGSGGFSSADYDATEVGTGIWPSYSQPVDIDVTQIVRDIYTSNHNYGLVLRVEGDSYSCNGYSSELSTVRLRPTLEVTYSYPGTTLPQVSLTVNSGSGTGTYEQYNIVAISAGTPPSGQAFDEWIGDTAEVADVYSASTDIYLRDADATVTATFATGYTLTVNSGSGSGVYVAETVVAIEADEAPTGMAFVRWTGDTEVVDYVNGANTTVVMDTYDAEITATYGTIYTLTVNSGDGSGTYAETMVVGIEADAAPVGQEFDQWVGDTVGIADVNEADTTITIQPGDAEITATYTSVPVYTLTVNNGTGGGDYNEGWVADVAADAPPAGQIFAEWIGDTQYLADVYDGTTTFTMPAMAAEITATYVDAISLYEVDTYGDTATPFDDAFLEDGSNTNYGNPGWPYEMFLRSAPPLRIGVLGIKEMFTLLPRTDSGDALTVISATLSVRRRSGDSGDTIYANRCVTDWLPDAAGANEDDVSGMYSEMSSMTSWASGGVSDADYDSIHESSSPWSSDYGARVGVDVTDIVQDMYDSGINYGFVLSTDDEISLHQAEGATYYESGPRLTIIYAYEPMPSATLIVNSGSGSGTYSPSTDAAISADPAPSGSSFDQWVGDTAYVEDPYAASTTVHVRRYDVEVTAVYSGSYLLTVNSGTGGGYYLPGRVVDISADAGPSGMVFDEWIGDTDNVADVGAASTTITMPGQDAEVTATYRAAIAYTLTVTNGSPNGDFLEQSVINLVADAPTSGMIFDIWVGDVSTVEDINSASTTMVMPAQNTNIVATYAVGYVLTVHTGSGDGVYREDEFVDIEADTIPSMTFEEWVGDVATVADIYDPTTTIKMPGYDAEVTATYVVQYTLTVNNGTGGGTYFENEVVDISADDPAVGTRFLEWVGDTDYVADTSLADTTVTMPAADVEVTATYEGLQEYSLTVNSGSGTGTYYEEEVVAIQADAAPSGKLFAEWTGDVGAVADVYAASTSVTMPAGDVEVTATYADAYQLTVNSGSGSGMYPEGGVANVVADTEPVGYVFDQWIGDTASVDDVSDPSTTVSMPASAVEITATYVVGYDLTVNGGSGSGLYPEGAVVGIAADAAASGMVFDQWIGDTAELADPTLRSTTVTIPAYPVEVTAQYKPDIPDGFRISFREGGGDGYTDTIFDDTYMVLDPADSEVYGTETSIAVVDGPVTSDPPEDQHMAGLVCVTDMFTLLPPSTGGSDITINKAYLIAYRYLGPQGTPFSIARVITDWLPDAAGSNEIDVSGLYSENSTYTTWANFLTNFDTGDYDEANALDVDIQDGGYAAMQKWDVTSLVQDIYYYGTNYGLALIPEPDFVSPDYTDPNEEYYGIYLISSESTNMDRRPVLQIDYQYGDMYQLTVNSGTGDGTYYESEVVEIVANVHPSGDAFAAWVGDTGVLDDPNAATTDVTMPAADVEVTATYTPPCVPCNGDLDGSGFVGQGDLDIVLDQWGNSGGEITDARADPSGDDFVGQADLDIVLDDWGKSCE